MVAMIEVKKKKKFKRFWSNDFMPVAQSLLHACMRWLLFETIQYSTYCTIDYR